jgi:beta-lactam-binding protein with PASTA domain
MWWGQPEGGRARDTLSGVIRVAVLSLVALVLGATGLLVASRYLSVDDVVLPDVRGVGLVRATETLRELGLRPLTFPELDATAAPDSVVSQTPAAATTVRRGRTVRLGVNALAEARQVPTVVGLREAEAVARAASVNANVARVSYVPSDRPTGTVVRQEPEPGGSFGAAQGLHLVVSRGLAEAPVDLPDVRGMTIEDARRTLQGIGIRQIDEVASALSFDRPFAVTDQRPAPGSEIMTSTPVTLVYALEGNRVVRVPDVAGEPLWRAQLLLRAARLTIGPVQEVDDPTRPVGIVEARPSGYTVVGSPIALVVNGPVAHIDRTPLVFDDLPAGGGGAPVAPRLGGPGTSAALDAEALRQAEAALRNGDEAPEVDDEEDSVPAPGTTVLQGDGSRIIPFRFDPAQVGVASLTRDPYRLRVVVNDDQGERIVLDRRLEAGEGVAISVQIYGDEPLLQTFVNDSFFQAWRP